MKSNPKHLAESDLLIRSGWIPLKQWKIAEAQRLGKTLRAIETDLRRGRGGPYPAVRRVNKRVILVRPTI